MRKLYVELELLNHINDGYDLLEKGFPNFEWNIVNRFLFIFKT